MLKRLLVPMLVVTLGALGAGGCTDNSGNGNFGKTDGAADSGGGTDTGGSDDTASGGDTGGGGSDAATTEGGGGDTAGNNDGGVLDGVSTDVQVDLSLG